MTSLVTENDTVYQWTVIGAGPAGIAAIGKLLDNKIPADKIFWCDPYFKVGDLGRLWSNVSSNTKAKLFTDFLYACDSFRYESVEEKFTLSTLDPQQTCILKYMVEPLEWVTEQLLKQVSNQKTTIHSMSLSNRLWTLKDNNSEFQSHNVILATGALPSTLNYPKVELIPFDLAIDEPQLSDLIDVEKTYGVFGSSHSAMIILRYLVEMGVKKVINFYRSPCRYALDMGDWTLFDNTGLKGSTAQWAREHIDGKIPENLNRYLTTESNIARFLPECDQIIYAVGFEKRNNILIGDYEETKHNPHVGIIGPGLFGFGIGYPELKTDPFGSLEAQVGLWKFITYLNKVLPLWIKYHT